MALASVAKSAFLSQLNTRCLHNARNRTANVFMHEKIKTLMKSKKTMMVEMPVVATHQPLLKLKGWDKMHIDFAGCPSIDMGRDPEIIKAVYGAVDRYGMASGQRVLAGTLTLHKEVEAMLANFHSRDDAIVYSTGYAANLGLFKALLTAEDAVLSDALNHRSIIDGIKLSNASLEIYYSCQMDDLERLLKGNLDKHVRAIITDGVFSMDGSIAPLDEICDLADEYDAVVLVDDTHGAFVCGETGKGSEEITGCSGRPQVLTNSLKGLSIVGGYVVGSQQVVDVLRHVSNTFIYSSSYHHVLVAAAKAALEIFPRRYPNLRAKLVENIHRFRNGMKTAGFEVRGHCDVSVCPVMTYDDQKTFEMEQRLIENGIFVKAIYNPLVPKGLSRIRVLISSSHSLGQIDTAVKLFSSVGKDVGLID